MTFTVCATLNIAYLAFTRRGLPKHVCAVSLPHHYCAKHLPASIYYSLDSVCSVVLCIKPETCIVF